MSVFIPISKFVYELLSLKFLDNCTATNYYESNYLEKPNDKFPNSFPTVPKLK